MEPFLMLSLCSVNFVTHRVLLITDSSEVYLFNIDYHLSFFWG